MPNAVGRTVRQHLSLLNTGSPELSGTADTEVYKVSQLGLSLAPHANVSRFACSPSAAAVTHEAEMRSTPIDLLFGLRVTAEAYGVNARVRHKDEDGVLIDGVSLHLLFLRGVFSLCALEAPVCFRPGEIVVGELKLGLAVEALRALGDLYCLDDLLLDGCSPVVKQLNEWLNHWHMLVPYLQLEHSICKFFGSVKVSGETILNLNLHRVVPLLSLCPNLPNKPFSRQQLQLFCQLRPYSFLRFEPLLELFFCKLDLSIVISFADQPISVYDQN